MSEPRREEPPARVVLISAPDRDVAASLARAIVDERLAACVSLVGGVTSVYRWEGAVHEESEVLMLVKTGVQRLEELRVRVDELHPYEVPEFVVLAPERVHPSYLAWLLEACAPQGGAGEA